jgi:hypothetical protein
MNDDDYRALVDDIRANGLREPGWTWQGQIVDGRHRDSACREAGVEFRTREWDGVGSLTAFVISLNLKRRQLTQSQKAMVALATLPMFEAEAKERMLAGKRIDPSTQLNEGLNGPGKVRSRAIEHAAGTVGVSPTMVSYAKRIATQAPEMVEQVRGGKIALSSAIRELQPSPGPRKSLEVGPRREAIDRASYQRVSAFLSGNLAGVRESIELITAPRRGLPTQLEGALVEASPEDVSDWLTTLEALIKAARQLTVTIKGEWHGETERQ